VEIGAVDVELIGLTEITKHTEKHPQDISSPRLRFAQSGWANKSIQQFRYTKF